MASAPHGPLSGHELYRAIEVLTDKQLRAYRYYRDGQNTMGWIATRLGTSRQAVMQLVVKAEKNLGYEPSFTPKQKTPYKAVADRRADEAEAKIRAAVEAIREMTPERRRRVIRAVFPSAPRKIGKRTEARLLSQMILDALHDQDARERMAKSLEPLERNAKQRRRAIQRDDDDRSSAVGEHEAEVAASLEADFGTHPTRGDAFRPDDFVVDDGRGYDRL